MRFQERPQMYNFKVADDEFSGRVHTITSDDTMTTVVFVHVTTTLPHGTYRYDNGRLYFDPADKFWKYAEKIQTNHNFARA